MSNNIIAKNSDGTSYSMSSNDIGGIHWSYEKLAFGADGTATIVSTSNGLPVQPSVSSTWVLGAGTAAIGTLAANSGVDIGDVTINNASGASAVNVQDGGNSLTVDGAVTANAPVADKASFTEGSGLLMPMGAVMNDTLSGAVGEDQIAVPRITAQRGLHVNLRKLDGTEIGTSSNPVVVGDGSGSLTVDGTVAATQSGTYTVQPGNTPNTSPWLVQDKPATSGGLSMSKTISAASTNATSVKGSAGQVYAIQVFNSNAAARYLKLYNKASAPTVGTDTPVKVFMIPAGGGAIPPWDKGLAFSTGIAFATTTGAADNDTGAVAAAEVIVNIDYV